MFWNGTWMLFRRKSFLFMIPSSNPALKGAVLRIRIRRIRMFLGLPDPDLLARGTDPDPDPSIIKQKRVRTTLIPTVLWLLSDFLSLKNYVNVASKSNKQKNLKKIKFVLPSWRSLTKTERSGSGSEKNSFSAGDGTDKWKILRHCLFKMTA